VDDSAGTNLGIVELGDLIRDSNEQFLHGFHGDLGYSSCNFLASMHEIKKQKLEEKF